MPSATNPLPCSRSSSTSRTSRIDGLLASVEAHVLRPPQLNYHDSGCEKNVLSKFGHWDMMNKDFSIDHVLPQLILKPEHVERALKPHYQDAMNILKPKDNELDRLIVILPDNNGSLNGDLKRICETDLRSV
ncbi:hypothetical protein GUJ93_ZPchr0012g20649 [Zizania palustris]|uniref:Uncharacterized protein n=1 Tax=Zizania palustris TaxID=103762 RepID=A0A8J5WUL6_ZIZPA|nr:hypothetical protein GUJ93_ZPchr0012g20649 [Zizania palustris]